MAQQIQLRRGTASQWTSANPILADGEIGIETDTGLYKVGDGVNTWSARAYSTLQNIDTGTVVNMSNQATPSAPASSTLNLYANTISGRIQLTQQSPNGLGSVLQASLAQKNIAVGTTGTTTSIASFGHTFSAVGSVTHPASTELYGYMANFATSASINSTSGAGGQLAFVRGFSSGSGGFYYYCKLGFPDSSYNETGASTGSRVFVGLTDGTVNASANSDNPSGNFCGFFRRSVNAGAIDTNWLFATKDNVTLDTQDTGIAFTAQKVYEFYCFCEPAGNTIFWEVRNITDNTSASGNTNTNLPTNTAFMRAGFQLHTINAVVRNIRMQRVLVESDK